MTFFSTWMMIYYSGDSRKLKRDLFELWTKTIRNHYKRLFAEPAIHKSRNVHSATKRISFNLPFIQTLVIFCFAERLLDPGGLDSAYHASDFTYAY
jgi:hypothetical protein